MKTIEKKVPYHKKPDGMTIDKWQILLREQYGIKQDFEVCNIGDHPVYTDYTVYNPESESTYKVAIRSMNRNEGNFCSCPDFTINTLGTCKHIEYVLYVIQSDDTRQKYLSDEVSESYSSLSIRYEKDRKLYLTVAPHLKAEMKKITAEYFYLNGYLYPNKLIKIDYFIKKAIKIDHNFMVYPDVSEYISSFESRE